MRCDGCWKTVKKMQALGRDSVSQRSGWHFGAREEKKENDDENETEEEEE